MFIWDEAGNVRITDLAKNEILSSIQYQAEYGTIYNAMTPSLPKGANQITLDQSPAFQPGAAIEIRSESFGGILYHAPNVSSLELIATQKQLIVNLDHMNDHRYVQQGSTNQVGKVRHASEYRANDERTNSFSLVVGYQPMLMPRFISQPSGFLATHVWTEHADEQTLQTNRAVYFGSEKITSSAQATGGFVKHRIPVTKSVFYSNPYFQAKSPVNVAIAQCPEFLQFLDDLNRNDNDMGLHTLYPYEIRHYQKTTEDALQVMKDHFQSSTWIDHGYLKSSFAFNALDNQTANYLAHQWKKYDTSYFWHYSSEDIANPNHGLDLYQPQRGDALRTPLYWSHPTVTGPFYSWSAAIIPEDTLYLYREQNLQQLIQNRGVFINHTYLAIIPSKKQGGKFIIRDIKSNWIIHPDFDRLLKRMDTLCDQGKLHLTTVREIKVYVNGMKPSQKKADGDLIFWFDLEPNAVAVIAANKVDSIALQK
ncbi:hypothetical protein [Brevibacillus sp. HB1.2]|uniref:hypothetical protein n=1 Tax=Brevibacillus sp. HB1.2 TaxID=2738807 RepID=UPI0020C64037|nr:hypothetical protein [Brevibacillus sp. HB1.2]